MSITYKVYNFPTFPIAKQLFHVPGAMVSGGFTSGGARISSSEPGGFSVLEIQPSMQVGEWEYPLSSWLMSKINGQILRVRLAPTPQVSTARKTVITADGVPWDNNMPWNNEQNWQGDYSTSFLSASLEGTILSTIDVTGIVGLLQQGHVIGHNNDTYLIDEIEYYGNVASLVTTPPFRRNIVAGDACYLRPYFTGMIANGGEMRNTYDAENAGNIQLNKIVLSEVII